MKNKQSARKPSVSYKPITKLPELAMINPNWDLVAQYYTNDADSRIEADITKTIQAYLSFAKRWRGKDFTSNKVSLLKSLN